ncbi:TlpA family protein disulfide reductase [Robertkochia solimangrovi]|uniref:TlpA family protein disulfide reductase n=1 Tax=Robertkochia solimangrovi TaxID=2213046 RepID=UPI00117D18C2|nr:TlpA disulfide reductase family protein [Robertkochia solimangrovi]TRZ42310.1 TlpA family protein disulfide reductase [Robertkochia solimangrovi]
MKKNWIFLAALSVVACKQETPVDYAVLSGKITNEKAKELTMFNNDRSVNLKVALKEDGSFMDTLKLAPGVYTIHDGKNVDNLYIEPGSNLNMTYDATDHDKTFALSGDNIANSNYLFEKTKKYKEIIGSQGVELYKLDEAAYIAALKEAKEAQKTLLSATAGVSEDFKAKEERNLEYAYLEMLNRYPMYHKHYAEMPDYEASDVLKSELDGIDYNKTEDFTFSSAYKNLVSAHYNELADEAMKKDSTANYYMVYLKEVAGIQSEPIRNTLLWDAARYNMAYSEDELENYYDLFQKSSTNAEHKEKITADYNKLMSLASGNPSPEFKSYENHAGGTTSLEDLKGKYLYIDVWATWCGPCRREIPSLKQLETDYHGKNIEFVSISIDEEKDYETWKKMVVDEELKGVQLLADNNWKSQFVEDYMIKGIPRFIIVDPEGKIVDYDAPRPSDTEVREVFDQLSI